MLNSLFLGHNICILGIEIKHIGIMDLTSPIPAGRVHNLPNIL